MRWKTKTFAFVFALIGWLGYTTASRGEDRDPSHFTYARLYCAPDGNTHFQDITAELRKENFAPPAPPIHIGSDFAASRAFFGGFDAGWGAQDLERRLNHPTPAIQFGIVLQGTFSITTTDGETRRLRPGSVFRLEDTSPCKGHITVVGEEPGFLMFVR
jgi:AraC-like ligand binding domain